MRYREYPPSEALRGVVHRFWTLRGDAPGPGSDFQRAMPDGRPELVFNLADRFESRRNGTTERQPAALVVGPTTTALPLRPTGRIDLVGVRLVPGPWPGLLGMRADESAGWSGWRPDAVGETRGSATRWTSPSGVRRGGWDGWPSSPG